MTHSDEDRISKEDRLMIRLKRFTTHILIPLAPSLFLGACGAVRQAVPEAESSTTVTGNAMLGPVDGATVTAYALAEDGSLDTSVVLGTATTDSNGEYTLTIPNSALPVDAPIGLEMNGGTYTEESSGDTVDLSGKSYTTLLASVDKSSSVNAAVGPLPDMAFKKFKAQMDAGLPPDSTMKKLVTDSNYQVSQASWLRSRKRLTRQAQIQPLWPMPMERAYWITVIFRLWEVARWM